ncbi:MAG TPA: nickel-binding protein [Chitinophagaceae bacterium]|nr:nickel-binding protein [Chitinophagaceae bacterium]
MPLFMDLHKASDYDVKPTVEDIKRNHIADLAIQHKYGVKFLQYWINEEDGLVFCLMEGPDKESCIAVHQEAHGGMPCNVIELKGGDYTAFIGDEVKANTFDIVENADGTFDTGYRVVLLIDQISLTAGDQVTESIQHIIKNSGGRQVSRPGHRQMIVFTSAHAAIDCALKILEAVQHAKIPAAEIRIGISAGEPVTDEQDFFGSCIQLANRLCDIAQDRHVVVSSLVKQLAGEMAFKNKQTALVKILGRDDEQFLHQLIEAVSARFYQPAFSIDDLATHLNMSRSALYRKITSLTGLSANAFIREIRLQKALQLIREKYGNVNEVALEAGFGNPSYFTRSFQKRFGIAPGQALRSA